MAPGDVEVIFPFEKNETQLNVEAVQIYLGPGIPYKLEVKFTGITYICHKFSASVLDLLTGVLDDRPVCFCGTRDILQGSVSNQIRLNQKAIVGLHIRNVGRPQRIVYENIG